MEVQKMRQDGESAFGYLERIPEFAREKSPLAHCREFLGLLGNPDRGFQIFHVAGTNGKGSVCAFLTSMLCEAGVRCASFTSPHLADIRERFLLEGDMISEKDFTDAFEVVYQAVLQWTADGKSHPTYFEFLFYMALVAFRKLGASVLILETGMGGLRDVTNVVERPLACVITSISIDHTAYLGETVEAIARHKAGIIKPGVPVVFDDTCPQASGVITEQAAACKSRAVPVAGIPCELILENGRICLTLETSYRGERICPILSFPAPYQAVNAVLAVRAVEASGLPIGQGCVLRGLFGARWPARMEQVLPRVYLDGAHNVGGISAFLSAACLLKERMNPKRVWLMFAVSGDKEYRDMLREIMERLAPDICLLSGMHSKRALSSEELLKEVSGFSQTVELERFEYTAQALDILLTRMDADDMAFIVGSLYLAGEVRQAVLRHGTKGTVGTHA